MKFQDSSPKSISETLSPLKVAIKRYSPVSWAPALVIFALVAVLSVRLPSYYVSDVLIFVLPQKVNSTIVKNDDKEEDQERFEAMLQELISRPRLRAIMDKFQLYPELMGIEGREKALDKFRKEIVNGITPVIGSSGKPVDQTFRVAYSNTSGKLAYEVVKSLANLFIEESIVNQRSETQGTEEFLDGQLKAARSRLEITEAEIQQFVRQNVGKLPEHRDQALARLTSAQEQLASNSQLIAANVARLGYLRQELKVAASDPGIIAAGSGEQQSSDPQTALAQLENALVVLRSRYSDKHPDVITTRQKISMLKARLKEAGGSAEKGIPAGVNREARALRHDVNELEVEIRRLAEDNDMLKKGIAILDADIKSMPIKEQELIRIKRDYENVKESYERLMAAKENASLQSSLVRSQKSSQFKIVDPPSEPVIPAGPNRWIILGVGLIVAIVVYLGIPIACFFLNGSFKFRDEAENELDLLVLAAIPPMKTPVAALIHRRAATTTLAASIMSFFVGSLIIFIAIQ